MKNSFTRRNTFLEIFASILVLLIFAIGCNKENGTMKASESYNPSDPVTINDFFPKEGGGGEQLVIYGDNFGNDTSIVNVTIAGKDAIVINVHDDAIYCLVPGQAYKGNIEVTVGKGENQRVVTADTNFAYQRKMIVSTLLGETDDRGNYDVKNGPFDDCGGIYKPWWLKFDPKDSGLLYVGEDFGGDIRLLNFHDSTVSTPITTGMGNWSRIRTIDFTLDGNYMIIANDQGDKNGIATSILSRANDFKDPQVLTSYKQCNGASIHPITGELYFNSYEKGQFFRFDINRYISQGDLGIKDYNELFKIQDVGWEFHIAMAPNGNYAYILVVNKHYILRTDYNWDTKRFMQPYVVCGKAREAGWVDGVGTEARLNGPYQGVFVKNPDYAGQKNQYDFYFTEQYNHDIRILSPDGKVTTFAGRGSSSIDSNPYGYIDGDLRTEARFDQPRGIAYDARNNVFYVGDCENHRIRKIAMEGK